MSSEYSPRQYHDTIPPHWNPENVVTEHIIDDDGSFKEGRRFFHIGEEPAAPPHDTQHDIDSVPEHTVDEAMDALPPTEMNRNEAIREANLNRRDAMRAAVAIGSLALITAASIAYWRIEDHLEKRNKLSETHEHTAENGEGYWDVIGLFYDNSYPIDDPDWVGNFIVNNIENVTAIEEGREPVLLPEVGVMKEPLWGGDLLRITDPKPTENQEGEQ